MTEKPEQSAPGDVQKLMAFEASKKSAGVAYLLWLFLGGIGGHRFYLGHAGVGIGMIVALIASLFLAGIPILVWWIIEFFLVPSNVSKANHALISQLEGNITS